MEANEQEGCACGSAPRAQRIARLNDQLRTTGAGGRVVITRGVLSLPSYDASTLLCALRVYDRFDADNDPHGERDFGHLDFCGAELLWKVDYYDPTLKWGSSDPADSTVTVRILTIMLADEY